MNNVWLRFQKYPLSKAERSEALWQRVEEVLEDVIPPAADTNWSYILSSDG